MEAGEVAVAKTLGKVNGIRMPRTYFYFYLFNITGPSYRIKDKIKPVQT